MPGSEVNGRRCRQGLAIRILIECWYALPCVRWRKARYRIIIKNAQNLLFSLYIQIITSEKLNSKRNLSKFL